MSESSQATQEPSLAHAVAPVSTSGRPKRTVPARSLHVLAALTRGGVETWLMHLLRNTSRDDLVLDVCLLDAAGKRGPYEEEFQERGGRIWRCPLQSNLLRFARRFRALLQQGHYAIVHSHVHAFSGWLLRLAAREGVPVRIAHSHNDTRSAQAAAGVSRKLYFRLMKRWIRRHATLGLACSDVAAAALFGERWREDARWQLLPYGIDLRPFHAPIDPAAVREQLGLPRDAPVWGHVGRFCPQKNHPFLLEVFREALEFDSRLRLLLIGEGTLRPDAERQAIKLGIRERLLFAGGRSDVPRLMRGAMDLFVLPSLHEGLPLVLIEAQAAGLPCVVSQNVTTQIDLGGSRLERLSLNALPRHWARRCLDAMQQGRDPAGLDRVEASQFSIHCCAERLVHLYREAGTGAGLEIEATPQLGGATLSR